MEPNDTDTSIFTNIDDLNLNLRKPNLEDFWKVESIGITDYPKHRTTKRQGKCLHKLSNSRREISLKEDGIDSPVN